MNIKTLLLSAVALLSVVGATQLLKAKDADCSSVGQKCTSNAGQSGECYHPQGSYAFKCGEYQYTTIQL